jgi:hypothetical protein
VVASVLIGAVVLGFLAVAPAEIASARTDDRGIAP